MSFFLIFGFIINRSYCLKGKFIKLIINTASSFGMYCIETLFVQTKLNKILKEYPTAGGKYIPFFVFVLLLGINKYLMSHRHGKFKNYRFINNDNSNPQ